MPGLPPERDGLTLVALSDLHLGTLKGERWLSQLLVRVNALKPDLVVVVGDLVDGNVRHVEALLPTLKQLRSPLGVWAVTGNHEYYAGLERSVQLLEAAGYGLLRDCWVEVAPGLILAGVDDLTAREQFGQTDGAVERALANVSWTPAPAPEAPSWIAASVGDGQTTLNWAAFANASFLDTGLVSGTAYYYVVSATNLGGESASSMQTAVQPVSRAPLTFSHGVSGNRLQLSWPADHLGWRLEAQTNSLITGIGTNWVTIPGSSATNQVSLVISPTHPSVFFRSTYP